MKNTIFYFSFPIGGGGGGSEGSWRDLEPGVEVRGELIEARSGGFSQGVCNGGKNQCEKTSWKKITKRITET